MFQEFRHTLHLEVVRLRDIQQVVPLGDLQINPGTVLFNESDVDPRIPSVLPIYDHAQSVGNLLLAGLRSMDVTVSGLRRGRERALGRFPPLRRQLEALLCAQAPLVHVDGSSDSPRDC